MATPRELASMQRAIALSAFGLGTTSPNPPVGCVVLDRNGQLVGQGYHRRKGEDHAEVIALAQAGEQARDGTAAVTLEPCSHYGRTPPCHQALIDAGIRRVLVALIDPASRGDGGVAVLRRAGLDVEIGVLPDEALLVFRPWLRARTYERPYVHWVHVLDGAPETDALQVIPDADSLKAGHDVVLTAEGTVSKVASGEYGNNLAIPTQVDLTEPKVALEALYRGGVRSVLLVADHERVSRFLNIQLIDHISAYMSDRQAPATTQSKQAPLALPDGFRLLEVAKLPGWIRLSARTD